MLKVSIEHCRDEFQVSWASFDHLPTRRGCSLGGNGLIVNYHPLGDTRELAGVSQVHARVHLISLIRFDLIAETPFTCS